MAERQAFSSHHMVSFCGILQNLEELGLKVKGWALRTRVGALNYIEAKGGERFCGRGQTPARLW